MHTIVFLFILAVLSIPSLASAATYYVATTGDNLRSCTTAQTITTPKQTIVNAAACLTPGDTLIVRGGTYTQTIGNAIPGGTASAPVTVRAHTGETVLVRPSISGSFMFEPSGVSKRYIVLDGINLDGNSIASTVNITNSAGFITIQNAELQNGDYAASCIQFVGNYDVGNNTFQRLNIHHCGSTGLHHGLYITNANNIVEYCDIHDNAGYGIHAFNSGAGGKVINNTFRYNKIYNNNTSTFGFGLIVSNGTATSNNYIHNNILYGNHHCLNIQSNGNRIYNNTCYNNNASSGGIGVNNVGANNLIKNNVLASQNDPINSPGTGAVFDNNLCTASDTGCEIVNSVPGFVNTAGADFSLTSTSPARNAGVTITDGTCRANNCPGAFAGAAPATGAHEEISAPLSAVVQNATPSILTINWPLNTAAFSPLDSCTAANFAVQVNGSVRGVNSCTIVGSNRTDLTLASPIASDSDAITFDYTAGTLRNSAEIGRGTGAVGTGSNQKVFSCTNCATVQNLVTGSCAATPTFASATVQNATPTVVTLCTSTNDPPMTPATAVTGITITGKTISGTVRNATDNKCFDSTVTAAFTTGETQTIAYAQSTGNILSSGACTPELAAFSGQAIQNNVQPSAPVGLVAHWKFDEGTETTAADDTGNGHAGTVSGATWTTGISGGALSFNGTNAMVEVADHNALDFSTAFTISAWVKPSANHTTFRSILRKGPAYYLYGSTSQFCGAGFPVGGFRDNTLTNHTVCHAVSLPQDPQWTHMAVTYNQVTLRLYRNGVEVANAAQTAGLVANTNTVRIGASEFTEFFQGAIDEVRVYDDDLTAAQVQALFAPGPVVTSAVVDTATPGIIKVCTSTPDLPLLPASDCALAGFAVSAGHTITDCDRAGASPPDNACMNLAVTPNFSSGEPARTLAYDPSLGNVTSSAGATPELALFTGLTITNNVQPGAAIDRDQDICDLRSWGGAEDTPDWKSSLVAIQHAIAGERCGRLRCSVINQGTNDVGSRGYTWCAEKNGGTCDLVTSTLSTAGIWFAVPPELSTTATTEQLTADPTNFIAGAIMTSENSTPSVPSLTDPAWAPNKRIEFEGEFCIGPEAVAGADPTTADDWKLKIVESDGTPLETYTIVPQVFVTTGRGWQGGGSNR